MRDFQHTVKGVWKNELHKLGLKKTFLGMLLPTDSSHPGYERWRRVEENAYREVDPSGWSRQSENLGPPLPGTTAWERSSAYIDLKNRNKHDRHEIESE